MVATLFIGISVFPFFQLWGNFPVISSILGIFSFFRNSNILFQLVQGLNRTCEQPKTKNSLKYSTIQQKTIILQFFCVHEKESVIICSSYFIAMFSVLRQFKIHCYYNLWILRKWLLLRSDEQRLYPSNNRPI